MESFRERQKELKQNMAKNVIFEATIGILLEKGTEGLKMQEIASRSGIATGTLYNYFKNRKDLLCYVDKRLRYDAMEVIESHCSASGPADQRFSGMIRDVLEFCRKHHVVFDLADKLGIKDMIPTEEKQDGCGQAVECIERLLNDGIRQGQFCVKYVGLTAKMFFTSLIGALEMRNFLDDTDSTQYEDDLIRFYGSLLKAAHEN